MRLKLVSDFNKWQTLPGRGSDPFMETLPGFFEFKAAQKMKTYTLTLLYSMLLEEKLLSFRLLFSFGCKFFMLLHACCTTFSLWHREGLVATVPSSSLQPLLSSPTCQPGWDQDPTSGAGASPGEDKARDVWQQPAHHSKAALSSRCPVWLHVSSTLGFIAQTPPRLPRSPTLPRHPSPCPPAFFLRIPKAL